jgi:hypothetical protein
MKVSRVCTAVALCTNIFADLRRISMNAFGMPCKKGILMITHVWHKMREVIPAKFRVYQALRTLKVKA